MWPDKKSSQAAQLDPSISSGEAFFNSIQKLSPQNDVQRSLKSQAVQIATDLGQMRWLLFEQTETSISLPMLIILISWLAIIFMSIGLFAPPNATVIVALMLAALSVSGAIFLILELDMPFDGVIQISPAPMRNALVHLGH
jgi:membrane-bound ClpP family serine protease